MRRPCTEGGETHRSTATKRRSAACGTCGGCAEEGAFLAAGRTGWGCKRYGRKSGLRTSWAVEKGHGRVLFRLPQDFGGQAGPGYRRTPLAEGAGVAPRTPASPNCFAGFRPSGDYPSRKSEKRAERKWRAIFIVELLRGAAPGLADRQRSAPCNLKSHERPMTR